MSLHDPSSKFSTRPSESHARKRPVSERKILANRKNALHSTGPRTERGKRTVSCNAITHGILAREVVITAGDGEESREEFQALAESLREHYEPIGTVETMLVERIAVNWWRLGRAIRAENGEIRKRLDTLSMDRHLRKSDEGNLALLLSISEISLFNSGNPADAKVSTMERYSAAQAMRNQLREHRAGLTYLIQLLQLAKSEIAADGYMSERMRKKMFLGFYSLDLCFAFLCRDAGAPEAKTTARPPKRKAQWDVDPDTDRALVLALIDAKLEEFNAFKEYTSERERLALDAEGRRFSLPAREVSDKLLRYEAHYDRQLHRAMAELERLQRRRKGEFVPPPLNVNLGRGA